VNKAPEMVNGQLSGPLMKRGSE